MEIEMDSSTAQFLHHHQEMSSQTQESMLICNKAGAAGEKKPRPADEAALNCPRCDSTNTKFCYYNNYSLTQPRYFCKSCRRYWTKGGTLRNVPVGGGCRRTTKRPSSSSSSPTSSSSSKRAPPSSSSNQFLPNYHHLPQRGLQSQANVGGFDQDHFLSGNYQNTPIGSSSSHDQFLGGGGGGGRFLDAVRGGFLENGLFHNVYSSFGDKNEMGNVENGGIWGLSNVISTNQDQLGMNNSNSSLYNDNDHQEDDAMVKQEGGERRVLWGFPWQIGGSDHQGNVIHEEVDSGRSKNSWNGFGSTWHGLLNSPLM